MNASDTGQPSATYQVSVNGRIQSVGKPRLSMHEIWALGGIQPGMDLVMEGVGGQPDRMLMHGDIVDLSGDHVVQIFSRPPTNFG